MGPRNHVLVGVRILPGEGATLGVYSTHWSALACVSSKHCPALCRLVRRGQCITATAQLQNGMGVTTCIGIGLQQLMFVFVLWFVQLSCMAFSALVWRSELNISADMSSRYHGNVATKLSKRRRIAIYRVAQKVVHFSIHHILGTVQDKIKRISPKCS